MHREGQKKHKKKNGKKKKRLNEGGKNVNLLHRSRERKRQGQKFQRRGPVGEKNPIAVPGAGNVSLL